MATGFFMVLILERIVLNCKDRRGPPEEREALLPDSAAGHGHGHRHGANADVETSGHHVHVDFQAHSPFRSFMLFLSLSLHSVFEGLAIGLQNTDSKVRKQKPFHTRFKGGWSVFGHFLLSSSTRVKRKACGPNVSHRGI